MEWFVHGKNVRPLMLVKYHVMLSTGTGGSASTMTNFKITECPFFTSCSVVPFTGSVTGDTTVIDNNVSQHKTHNLSKVCYSTNNMYVIYTKNSTQNICLVHTYVPPYVVVVIVELLPKLLVKAATWIVYGHTDKSPENVTR